MNITTARFLAQVCEQTYTQYDNKERLFLVPPTYRPIGSFEARAFNGRTEPFGFVIESEQAVVIAFRGSRSTVDWIADFDADQVQWADDSPAIMTHRGFTMIYRSARDSIWSFLDQVPADKPLFLTGHSLGGALATLAAFDVACTRQQEMTIVYTFGSPRVGNDEFAVQYKKAVPYSFRLANVFDAVTHLPPPLYHSPLTDTTYTYKHVHKLTRTNFRTGSMRGNHGLAKYAKL